LKRFAGKAQQKGFASKPLFAPKVKGLPQKAKTSRGSEAKPSKRALPKKYFDGLGLLSLLDKLRRFQLST
jgi:hypothetical protein